MSKFTKIPSEIRSFLQKNAENRINPAFSKFTALLEDIRISDNDLGGVKRANCQLTNRQLFQIIILLSFLAVPGFSHYAESTILKMFGGREVRLFLCTRGKNENWKILLTTDLSIDFMRANEIYAMRWSIEVFFADGKRVLDLAGLPTCQWLL